MADEISGDLALRILNAMTRGDDEGKFLGDELATVARILASKCGGEDQERILAASLAGHFEMEEAGMGNDSAHRSRGGMADYRRAETAVRGVLTEDQILACDSAPAIYRKALRELGVTKAGAPRMPDNAVEGVFRAVSTLQHRTAGQQNFTGAGFACDAGVPASASAEADFHEQFPDASRVVRS